jgi:hypothetical protein
MKLPPVWATSGRQKIAVRIRLTFGRVHINFEKGTASTNYVKIIPLKSMENIDTLRPGIKI